jgi:hypothetical protein
MLEKVFLMVGFNKSSENDSVGKGKELSKALHDRTNQSTPLFAFLH